jgi:hypothetical protein
LPILSKKGQSRKCLAPRPVNPRTGGRCERGRFRAVLTLLLLKSRLNLSRDKREVGSFGSLKTAYLKPRGKEMRKKLLLKLSILPVLGVALFLSTPSNSAADQQLIVCADGSFSCNCMGAISCETSILDCWNRC